MTRPFLPHSGRIRLLASVMNADEAAVAVAGGADIVDAKDPREGALGALDLATIAAIRAIVPSSVLVSATTGDIPARERTRVVEAVRAVAATGVDFVKIGLFGSADIPALLQDLADCPDAKGRRVGVLLADREPDWNTVELLPAAGFAGVMIDTADKSSGSLPDCVTRAELRDFVGRARRLGLFVGLAGALRLRHIPDLLAIGPDIAGFRGGLCSRYDRVAKIDPAALAGVRAALSKEAVGTRIAPDR